MAKTDFLGIFTVSKQDTCLIWLFERGRMVFVRLFVSVFVLATGFGSMVWKLGGKRFGSCHLSLCEGAFLPVWDRLCLLYGGADFPFISTLLAGFDLR